MLCAFPCSSQQFLLIVSSIDACVLVPALMRGVDKLGGNLEPVLNWNGFLISITKGDNNT